MGDTRFNIEAENFDLYFEKLIPTISHAAKEGLPRDVLYKMRVGKLSFLGRLFILWKCLKKRWWIVVEEENGGLSIDQFTELREAIKRREFGIPKAQGLVSSGTFVTASKELADSFEYLNRLSNSPAYNFLQRVKNKTPNNTVQWNEQMKYIVRFLAFYESNKKTWVESTGIMIPEFLVLIYCYRGDEVKGSDMYGSFYKRAYQSSPRKIKVAFMTLQSRGLLKKSGNTSTAKWQITPSGKELINSILTKYALNC